MEAPARSFLEGVPRRPAQLPEGWPFDRNVELFLGNGPSPIEVLLARTRSAPNPTTVRTAWKKRRGQRASPLLLVVAHDDRVALCGPSGEEPPAFLDVDRGQAERLCREALEQPDRHVALRCLRDALPAVDPQSQGVPGIRNEGFLATHELVKGARALSHWTDADRRARAVVNLRGQPLLEALGFRIERCDRVTSILRIRGRGKKIAVAILLEPSESADLASGRFNGSTPISYALQVAEREGLKYVFASQGSKLRLHPVDVTVGVGRRGPAETFVEVHTGLLRDVDAAYLWLLFSGEALMDGGSLGRLLEESRRFAVELAARLRDRIYGKVIPLLAEGIAAARGLRRPEPEELAVTYEMAMTVLFRLLFIAYAEDKDLLPYRQNGLYQRRSLKTKATELLDLRHRGVAFDEGDSLWRELDQLFRAVESGNGEWGVPPYDGGLFSRDPDVSKVGEALAGITLSNTVVGPALCELLLSDTADGVLGPVDFRSLGVREFGTIYEGLLESELAVAESDLAIDREGVYRPAARGEVTVVAKGRIYLHDRSGARKSSGSYFTKEFAVEHLLDKALEPALADHFARLDKLDDEHAAERLFDFRVADIAMGSGHFLVAAVDRIERGFRRYLANRRLPGVRNELARLQAAATEAFGEAASQFEIEDSQLLRRLIARRCIYGVDVNPVAVHLARLSIWIHTFVPGLPLSLLDHNLVVGNSLVGIGKLDELRKLLGGDEATLFKLDAESLLGEAVAPLSILARLADTTATEVAKARRAMTEAREAAAPAAALFDIATAARLGRVELPPRFRDWESVKSTLIGSREHERATKELAHLAPFHFPVAFPEVFLRERPGFDVILGNPPWQEATLEEHAFWARHAPGLRGLNQREQETAKARLRDERKDLVAAYEKELAEAEATRRVLTTGPYPGMGTGDPDLYKAFCWRFWNLCCSEGGRVGVVLPREVLCAKGSAQFRDEVLRRTDPLAITTLVNSRQWVFPDVHPQTTIALVSLHQTPACGKTVHLLGPFASRERFDEGSRAEPAVFEGSEVRSWTDTAAFPLLPTELSLSVFAVLRQATKLGFNDLKSWRARPHRELDATNDKHLMDVESEECPRGFWPVFKGESFDLWTPDTNVYYAYADPEVVIPHLFEKQHRGARLKSSPFSEFDRERLRNQLDMPCMGPRIAFRDGSRATDSRTVRVALVPSRVFIANQAPYFLWPRGSIGDQAFVLGVLSSVPLDWYARRFVEKHVSFFVINPFPVPRPVPMSRLRERVIQLAGRLACPDARFAEWAESVGVDCGPLPDDQKQDMIHELDAVVAHLYGLSEKHLVHIFETFHEGWDYEERLRVTLKHYRHWKP